MFTLRLLGGLTLEDPSGAPVAGRASQRLRLLLLARLALAPARTVSRDKLLPLLWPTRPAPDARHRLAATVYDLRQALGPEVIAARGDELVLDATVVRTDVEAFEGAVAAGDWEAAVGAYAGPLLDGVFGTEGEELEEWIAGERARLERAHARALAAAAEAREQRGDLAAAVDAWRRLDALEPGSARVTRRLMLALDAAGDRAAALRHAATHAEHMRREFDAGPDPEVLALAARLRAPPAATAEALTMPGEAPAPSGAPRAAPRAAPRGGPRWWRSRPALRVAAALVAPALLLLALLARVPSAPAAPRDVARVAVLPFAVYGDSSAAYLREGLVDLLATDLDGAGELRGVDPYALLASVRPRAGTVVDTAAGARAARRLGADLFVLGSVVASGERLRLHAALYRRDGRQVAAAAVDGAAARLVDVVDELTARLLADGAVAPRDRLRRVAALTTTSLPALKAYLTGEVAFRAGRFVPATEAFARAVSLDSTFALAHYRRSLAAMWGDQPDASAYRWDTLALRYSDRLSPRDRLLVRAYFAWRWGEADEAERLYRELVHGYPEDVEAWHQLGETLFHYNSLRGRPIAEAREPFARVARVDSTHWGALWHLAQLAAAAGRRDEFVAIADRLLAMAPDDDRAAEVRALRAVARRPAGVAPESLPELSTLDPLRAFDVAWRAAVYLHDADAARAALARDAGARLPLAYLDAGRGRTGAAAEALARPPQTVLEWRAIAAAALLATLPAPVTPWPAAADALRGRVGALAAAPARWRDAPDSLAYRVPLAHALLALAAGDTGAARRDADALARMPDMIHGDHLLAWGYAHAVRARLARARGDWAGTLRELDAARVPLWFGWTVSDPLGAAAHDRFLRAEALAALGRREAALAWYATIGEHSLYDLPYLGPAHLRRAELLAALGRRDEAAHEYEAVATLWRDGAPETRAALVAVAGRLAALGVAVPTRVAAGGR